MKIFSTVFLIILLLFINYVFAAEPLCPGGSSPRSDIIFCSDFETYTISCPSNSRQCWIDNGWTDDWPGGDADINPATIFRVVQGNVTNPAAVGNYYVKGIQEPGSVSGTGYTSQSFGTKY